MSAGSITFTDAIRSYAKNNGIDLSAEYVGILDSVLRSLGTVNDGQISFAMGEGQTGTFEEIMARETEGSPRVRVQKPRATPVAAGLNRTERAIATNAALRSEKSDAKAAMAVNLVAKFGSPWKSGNRTHQAFVTNNNPTLAKQLRNTAGH